MSVSIRLSRRGRIHRPFFRVVAVDKKVHREGVANEIVGLYDPLLPEKNLQVDVEKIERWLDQGAQLSPSLASLLKRYGYQLKPRQAKERVAKPEKKRDGKVWRAPSRRARLQHEAKLKAERKAAAAAAKPAEGEAKAEQPAG